MATSREESSVASKSLILLTTQCGKTAPLTPLAAAYSLKLAALDDPNIKAVCEVVIFDGGAAFDPSQ